MSDTRAARREAVRDFKRQAILDAAQRVFADRGLEGASMRQIAAEAGYTAGALYSYYPAKEHIYADILGHSLAELREAIRATAEAAPDPRSRAHDAAFAFYAYYRAHPRELDLSFYLFQGIGRRGLTPELDRQLNGRLIAALRTIAQSIAQFARIDEAGANEETVALACHLCGVLLLERSGRLKVFDQDGAALVRRHLDQVVARLKP